LIWFWFLITRGLKEGGLGFLFQPYRDDPSHGPWESQGEETAPLLDNRFQEHLETGMTLDEGGSIAQESTD
jgi:hypothetical protein